MVPIRYLAQRPELARIDTWRQRWADTAGSAIVALLCGVAAVACWVAGRAGWF